MLNFDSRFSVIFRPRGPLLELRRWPSTSRSAHPDSPGCHPRRHRRQRARLCAMTWIASQAPLAAKRPDGMWFSPTPCHLRSRMAFSTSAWRRWSASSFSISPSRSWRCSTPPPRCDYDLDRQPGAVGRETAGRHVVQPDAVLEVAYASAIRRHAVIIVPNVARRTGRKTQREPGKFDLLIVIDNVILSRALLMGLPAPNRD